MSFEEVRDRLFFVKDEEYRSFSMKLLPGVSNLIGVRLPLLRKLAREFDKVSAVKYISVNDGLYFEEVMLQGMLIGNIDLSCDEVKRYILEFLPKVDNWSICDSFCSSLKIVGRYKEELFSFFCDLVKSGKEFYCRFVLVIFLNYYIEKKYLDRVFEIVSGVRCERYYVMMGAAWLISICYIKYRKETLVFLKSGGVDGKTYNKALQKIVESNVVSDKEKDMIRKMKVKL